MKISLSELKLINMFIDKCRFDFKPFDEVLEDDKPIIDCDLDFDFDIKQSDNGLYLVFLTIMGNKDNMPGYMFDITGVGLFKIEGDLEKNSIDNLLNSALAMLIAHLRAFIVNVTNNMAIGRYVLPAIDLGRLIKDKNKESKEMTEEV